VNSYLLGKLTEEEAARVEAEYFDGDAKYAEFQSAQNDLFDAYAANRLSPPDREMFERNVLASPFLRRRAEFAQTLAERAEAERAAAPAWLKRAKEFLWPSAPGLRLGFAVAALLIVFGGAWLLREIIMRPRNQIGQTQTLPAAEAERTDRERERAARLYGEPARETEAANNRGPRIKAEKAAGRNRRPHAAIVSFTLKPSAFRDGANLPRLTIPSNARMVRLQLRFASGRQFRNFRVEIETIEGARIWTSDQLGSTSSQGERQVAALAPAGLLKSNDYLIRLTGRAADGQDQNVANYQMRVVKSAF